MTLVTAYDRVSHSAAVSPAQAVAYVRRRFPHHTEVVAYPWHIFNGLTDAEDQIAVPPADTWEDYSKCMASLINELAQWDGCQPSEMLARMAGEPV